MKYLHLCHVEHLQGAKPQQEMGFLYQPPLPATTSL